MKLLIVRHAPAGDRAAWEAEGKDDRLRPITPDGKKQLRRVAAGLATLVREIDILATSPLKRAAQTAEIIAAEYGTSSVPLDALAPESDPDQVVHWLGQHRTAQVVAVVGHEPHLSTLIGFLLTGKPASFINLKKSGASLVEVADPPTAGGGTLEWLLTPRILRRLGE